MQLANYNELFAVLTVLWTLFGELTTVMPGSSLIPPPPDIGVHPATGDSTKMQRLEQMSAPEPWQSCLLCPICTISKPDMGQRAVEMEDETFPHSWLFLKEEEILEIYEIADNPDNVMPPSHVQLTWRLINRWEYIYDTEQGLKSLFAEWCLLQRHC